MLANAVPEDTSGVSTLANAVPDDIGGESTLATADLCTCKYKLQLGQHLLSDQPATGHMGAADPLATVLQVQIRLMFIRMFRKREKLASCTMYKHTHLHNLNLSCRILDFAKQML